MSNDELGFELIDENDDSTDINNNSDEWTNDSDSQESKQNSEDDTTSNAKSNKSNWKKVNKLNKALIAENKRLKALADKAKSKPAEADEFDDLEDDEPAFDKTEFRFFLIENPEAKEYSAEIEATINDYPNLTLEDALALAKAKKPKESTSSDDFNTKSVNTKVRKRLSDLTDEEALKLDGKKYLEYMRLKGKVK